LITRSMESYSSMGLSRESKRLRWSSDWCTNTALKWKKFNFCVSPFCQKVQKHKWF